MDPIRLALSSYFIDETEGKQLGQDHMNANPKGKPPGHANPLSHPCAYAWTQQLATVLGQGRGARCSEAACWGGPAPTTLPIHWGPHTTQASRVRCQGKHGSWPRDKEWGPSGSDLLFPFLPHLAAPLDAAVAVPPQAPSCGDSP